jgi:hypothetical protein
MKIYTQATPLLKTILSPILVLRSAHHLPQLKLLGKLSRYCAQVSDSVMTSSNQSILGRNFAVGLYTKLEFVFERMWDLLSLASRLHIRKG